MSNNLILARTRFIKSLNNYQQNNGPSLFFEPLLPSKDLILKQGSIFLQAIDELENSNYAVIMSDLVLLLESATRVIQYSNNDNRYFLNEAHNHMKKSLTLKDFHVRNELFQQLVKKLFLVGVGITCVALGALAISTCSFTLGVVGVAAIILGSVFALFVLSKINNNIRLLKKSPLKEINEFVDTLTNPKVFEENNQFQPDLNMI